MKNSISKKTLVIGIIILFFGTIFVSVINANHNEINKIGLDDLIIDFVGKKQILGKVPVEKIDQRKNENFGPTITINFAGNLGELGGPYWQPPGESISLLNHTVTEWRDGYYTNDSRQREDWIYINVTVNDTGGVDEVWLHWYDATNDTWTNQSYEFINTYGDFWEFNTSGVISDVEQGHDYSFDIMAKDSLGNSNLVCWEKTGLGGGLTRRYVQLGCTPIDITYNPFYLRSYTTETGIYGIYDMYDLGGHDRLHHDQGPDGTITDTGYLSSTLPGDDVEDRYCTTFTIYRFDDSVCIEPFALENIYFHYWYASRKDDLNRTAWGKTRMAHSMSIDNYDPPGKNSSHSNVSYNSNDRVCYLNTHLLQTTSTSFTDNDIYELYLLFLEDPYARDDMTVSIKTISSRSIVSFVIFNVPDNATLSSLDSDSDGLDDWTELYVIFTSPFLADTDNDGATDYEEINGMNHGYWNSDPNDHEDTTDYRYELWVDAGGPYYSFINTSIQFHGSTLGGEPPYSWHWDFGDGNSSILQNPMHTFSGTGTNIVNLTVTDNGGNISHNTTTAKIQFPMVWVDDDFNESTSGWGLTHFNTIQSGVDNGPVNGCVLVYNGTYYENVMIIKPLTLLAEDRNSTIIDGNGRGNVVSIAADGVTIRGFTIRNSGNISYALFSAIQILSDYNLISGNRITNASLGIRLEMDSCYNIISGNMIGSLLGIWFHGCYIEGPTGNTVNNNVFIENYIGIYLLPYSSNNSIVENKVITGEVSETGIGLIGSSNNSISGNTISGYYVGIVMGHSFSWEIKSNDNIIYHNNFINNSYNAYDECNNTWYHSGLEEGNYWDDFEQNPGYPDVYEIPGGDNVDLYPLAVPYHPLPDLIISDFTATYNGRIVQLTATIKNNGTADITIPFQVSFSRSPTYTSPKEIHYNSIIDIGTVEIPLLPAGETAEATVYWKFLPEVNIISVFADSTRIIDESDESNNWASITV